MSLEQQVADLVTATTALTDAVNVKKTTLDTSVAAAGTSEANAAGSATASANSAAASAADRVLAESAKTGAQTAEANAVAVVSGGTAELVPAAGKIPISGATDKIDDNWLAYNIPALTAQYPGIVAVASCDYDTSKDSDGGAWIHRTAELSYGKEARPSGRYLGQYASPDAAAAVTGAVVGDWYYHTSFKDFRELTNVTTPSSVQIYRAGSAHIPSQMQIVAEANRVIIFDASGHQMTMWRVIPSLTSVTSVAAAEGVIFTGHGSADDTNRGLWGFYFAEDVSRHHTFSAGSSNQGSNAGISATLPVQQKNPALGELVHNSVSSLAVTVLDNAPVATATGLKIPTVAIGTEGGATVIKHDGTAVDITTTAATDERVTGVAFNGSELLLAMTRLGDGANAVGIVCDIPNADTDISALPNKRQYKSSYGGIGAADLQVLRAAPGYERFAQMVPVKGGFAGRIASGNVEKDVVLVSENPSDPAKSMYARITAKKNTGWMVGDIQGAYLCETETGSITYGNQLSGDTADFTNGIGSWGAISGATCVAVAGELEITSPAGGWGTAELYLTGLEAGRAFRFRIKARKGTASLARLHFLDAAYAGLGSAVQTSSATLTSIEQTVTVPSDGKIRVRIQSYDAGASLTAYFDDAEWSYLVNDHSGANNHLDIIGTLNRAPIGNGQIALFGGLTAVNYLESKVAASALNVGTGDFYVAAMVTGCLAYGNLLTIGKSLASNGYAGDGFAWYASSNSDEVLQGTLKNGSLLSSSATIKLIPGTPNHLVMVRKNGVLSSYHNGRLIASAANTHDLVITNDETLMVGRRHSTTNPNTSAGTIGLVKIGRTAPSADQIAKMYRDEKAMLEGKAVLDGNDSDVKALAYDKERDLLRVASQGVVSTFRGLERVKSSLDGVVKVNLASASVVTTGWTDNGSGKATGSAVPVNGSVLWDFPELHDGDTVLFSYRVKNRTAGSVRALVYGDTTNQLGSIYSADGTYHQVFKLSTAGGSYTNRIGIQAQTAAFSGDVEILGVYKISPAAPFTALSAHNGGLTLVGSNGVDLSLPAVSIRERLAQALPKPGRLTEDFYFTADGVTPSFALPKGWKPKRVAKDRNHQRVGANEDYTVTFDGFVYSVKFPIAPAINTEIDVEAVSV